MTSGVIARRYARAVFEISREAGQIDELGRELQLLADVYREVPELPALLANPVYTRAERKGIAGSIAEDRMGLSPTMTNLLMILIDNGRVTAVPEIANCYQNMADEAAGRVRVVVTSAIPVSEGDRKRLAQGLSRVTGKQVTVKIEIDASLIGGLSAQVGSLVLDGSIRAQLGALAEQLKRAS